MIRQEHKGGDPVVDKVYCYLCDQMNDVIIQSEEESHTIKGTSVHCEVKNAYCQQCGSKVYIPALNDANLERMDYAYREQQGIITVAETREILDRYNIGAKPLARMLGWGEVTILRYLRGQIPDRAHSDTLLSLKDPRVFAHYFEEKGGELTPLACRRVLTSLQELEKKPEPVAWEVFERSRGLLQTYKQLPGVYNGFTSFSLEKTVQAILFFLEREGQIYITRMNKLLWYADMLCYKRSEQQAITGLIYQNNHYGPVPRWWDFLYGSLDETYITLNEDEYGTVIEMLADPNEVFTDNEIGVLETVAKKFKGWSSKKISQYSHREAAYQKTSRGDLISFEYAHELSLS